MSKFNCIIMGAAGRDFHDFQTFFYDNPQFRVRAFTAAQIPYIEDRVYPQALARPDYEHDIPIYPEEELGELIDRFQIDFVFFAYSDVSHEEVMHYASIAQAHGASFVLLGPKHTQLRSLKPVIAVTAVRTGSGKSPLAQWITRQLGEHGIRVGVIRHPMPYGDLRRQIVERFEHFEDLDRHHCTVEEREEYEPYLEQGSVVFAGVDYGAILTAAQAESDVILWDGGNNDFSFIRPDLSIVVVDTLRAGHETGYYPGETNFRAADVLVLNKVRRADIDALHEIEQRIAQINPTAQVIESDLRIDVDKPRAIAGKRVLVVEDGPTLTHGQMKSGAGLLAARHFDAGVVVDPRESAVGTIAEVYRGFPHIGPVLPALGYSPSQCHDLARTINDSDADLIVDASPAGLERVLQLSMPIVRVRYEFEQVRGEDLREILADFLVREGVEEATLATARGGN